ncbi:MAG: LytTR family transcriptional regulator [Bacteroidales bacterium]|nr:LytTR family transcriptional regulator [Bacteroidales bacterium]
MQNVCKNRILIAHNSNVKIVDVGVVEYIKSDGCYSEIHLVSGEVYKVSKGLGYYEKLLGGYGFMRVHNGYLVNMELVTEIIGGARLRVRTISGEELPVTRHNKKEVMRFFM